MRTLAAHVFGSRAPSARVAAFVYRVVSPLWQPWRTLRALRAVPRFLAERLRYGRMTSECVPLLDTYPNLLDRSAQAGSAADHYFFQDLWAARKVFCARVALHVDVGSRLDGFVAHCAVFTLVEFVDLRPLAAVVPGMRFRQGSILSLPYATGSVASLSCLHAIEHIGLGRYGDPIDPEGTKRAAAELVRVLAPGGDLYIGVPVGRERVCFNAHRVLRPETVVRMFSPLKLVSFDAVDDSGAFVPAPSLTAVESAEYACGLFHFTRTQ